MLDLAVDAQNNVYATGVFINVNSTLRAGLARLEPNGSLSPGWVNPLNGIGLQVLADPDGTLMVVGAFTQVSFLPRSRVARITSAGTVDAGFVANADNTVFSVIKDGGGRYVLGGNFRNINGQARDRLAIVSSTGSVDPFNVGANASVLSTVILPDQSLVVGGDFSQFGGLPRTRLARVNLQTGIIDPDFNPQPDQVVVSLDYRSLDDAITAAGAFNRIGGLDRIGHALACRHSRSASTATTGSGAGPDGHSCFAVAHCPDRGCPVSTELLELIGTLRYTGINHSHLEQTWLKVPFVPKELP
ncbi:MAG: delta-60 repeat domain-containing protein [Ahniella sp.]|nr:delta-60 repeat domain-containing protein [Ahniella sp.]